MVCVVIADDDSVSRNRLASLLDGQGYDVLTTTSVASVIEGVLKDLAQVVILGEQVDGMAAPELLRILKQCRDTVKVILVCSEESPAVLRCLRREGIFYYLPKPVTSEDSDEVQSAVRCALGTVAEASRWVC